MVENDVYFLKTEQRYLFRNVSFDCEKFIKIKISIFLSCFNDGMLPGRS